MIPPHKKVSKAILHKLFIVDSRGGYAGEYAPDESCGVEFSQFLAAMPAGGLRDGQSIFLREWRATAIHGDRMGLIAISKGSLGPEEIVWARAALVAAEAHLTGPPEREDAPPSSTGHDQGVVENLARAITEREAQLAARETSIREMQEQARSVVEDSRKEVVALVADLKKQLEDARSLHEEDVKALDAERDRLREEFARIGRTSTTNVPTAPSADPGLEELRKKDEEDRKHLQRYASDLTAREEAIRRREKSIEDETGRLAKTREELDAIRAEILAAADRPPPVEWEAEKRELENRLKILQDKSMDLLRKEETLRAREQKLFEMLKQLE